MGRIIDFDNYKLDERYLDAAGDLADLLRETQERLATAGLNLAAAGVWRDWDATQPAGSNLCLDLEDLKHTDDELLTRLMAVYDLAEELESEIRGESEPS